mmetsp:Transcript_41445/g.100142  ORF Transcript_41445/g.100142 Transcript_41445/m.100142 type:complete len:205 (-) Transcript_41445:17-631(-)
MSRAPHATRVHHHRHVRGGHALVLPRDPHPPVAALVLEEEGPALLLPPRPQVTRCVRPRSTVPDIADRLGCDVEARGDGLAMEHTSPPHNAVLTGLGPQHEDLDGLLLRQPDPLLLVVVVVVVFLALPALAPSRVLVAHPRDDRLELAHHLRRDLVSNHLECTRQLLGVLRRLVLVHGVDELALLHDGACAVHVFLLHIFPSSV